jgi:hypothetical protein
MASKRSAKRLGDPEALGKIQNSGRMPWHQNGAFDPSIRAKNIFAFSPLVSGYEAKDTVERS